MIKHKLLLRLVLAAGLIGSGTLISYLFFLEAPFSQISTKLSSATRSYKEIDSYEEIKEVIASAEKDDLVVFAVDDTLIYPEDELVQHVENHGLRRAVFQKHPELIKPEESEKILSAVMLQSKSRPTEDNLLIYLRQLQEKKVPVIALTQMLTGGYGSIDRLEEWMYTRLTAAGINFNTKTIPEDIIFTTFAPFKHNHMRYYKGILCTHNRSKGEALEAFLDGLCLKPKRLIIIDASPNDLCALRESFSERELSLYCYCYTGAKKKYSPLLNIKRAVFQIDYLIKEGVWLQDKEASALLEHQEFSLDPDYKKKRSLFTEHKAKLFLEQQANHSSQNS